MADIYRATVECLQALYSEGTLQFLKVSGAVRENGQRQYGLAVVHFRSAVAALCVFLRRAVIFYAIVLVVMAISCSILCASFSASVATAAAIRYYTLSNVPGVRVTPLHFNALPFHGDAWRRSLPDDATMKHFFLSQSDAARASIEPVTAATDFPERRRSNVDRSYSLADHFADAKFSLLMRYVDSHLASSTFHIPRAAPSTEMFTPTGAVNLEALFRRGPPMFNALGEYTAKLQVVVMRDDELGGDATLVLESSVLFSEYANDMPPLHQLNVLFKSSTTATVRIGDAFEMSLLRALRRVLRLCFYIPVTTYEYFMASLLSYSDAPFPSIQRDREVSVVMDVYDRFIPPWALQPRLRAMNFTLYQLPDLTEVRRVKVSRMVLYSTVRLTGVAQLLADYPLVSFITLVVVFFALYVAVVVVFLGALTVYVYWRFYYQKSTVLEDSGTDSELFSSIASPSNTSIQASQSLPDLRMSGSEHYGSLDASRSRHASVVRRRRLSPPS